MEELWKDIDGYEGLYQVSNLGKVKSFCKSTKYKCPNEYILNPDVSSKGYNQVTLYCRGKRRKYLVHRLVATAFIPNIDNLPQINHKDENRLNNCVDNLEWCSSEYNNAYGTARIRRADKHSKPIEQLTYDKKVIAKYRSARIASELLGIKQKTITCAINSHRQCQGYFWRYSDYRL